MTVIAYKNGLLSSDSCISEGTVNIGGMRKIIRSRGGLMAGACGCAESVEMFLGWAKKSLRLRVKPDLSDSEFTGISIHPDGKVIFYEQGLIPYTLDAEFYAFGTGGDLALGAMAAGADAVEAVRIAIRFSHGCRGPIQAIHLDGRPYEFGPKGNAG